MEFNTQIINSETIKPSSPTPLHLKNFKLSFLDQFAPIGYVPLLFFYSINDQTNHSERFQILKQSLSETLTRFYPLAGRIIEADASIECNDDGVVLLQAKVNSPLFSFLEKPDADRIRNLLPVKLDSVESLIGSLLQVQITSFSCGGLAIGVCVSQKVSDGVMAATFVKEWAAIASGNRSNKAALPLFKASSVFPPQNLSFKQRNTEMNSEVFVTKRLVFDGFKIGALQAKSVSKGVKHPTRVESVTGLIWKCAMNSSRLNADHLNFSILLQSVNLRRRTVPSIPEYSIGNLAGYFASQATECDQIELPSLVAQVRKGIQDFDKKYVRKLQVNNGLLPISKSCNIDFYTSTSLCKFPFYNIDFGWGRPVWFTIAGGDLKNGIVMVDTKDGDGIEAWVTLSEDDMAFFERDQELLGFASLNPNVLLHNPIMPKSSL